MNIDWNEVINLIECICIFPCGILAFVILKNLYERFAYRDWDCGIRKDIQCRLQVHCPFDSSKGVLYIPRRVVGFWMNESKIHKLKNEVENRKLLEMLFRNYNLILYIPERDQHQVLVSTLASSIDFIIERDFPICYITQHLPIRSKTTPFPCNGDTLWFVMYKKGEPVDKWEGYS